MLQISERTYCSNSFEVNTQINYFKHIKLANYLIEIPFSATRD